MLLADIVATSRAVTATRSRLAKRGALVHLLRSAQPGDIEIVVSYLAGELRQRRTGIGWAALRSLPQPAAQPSLRLVEVDATLQAISELTGAGSVGTRSTALSQLLGRATAAEQDFLRRLVAGQIRQGALDSAMLDAIAEASAVPLVQVRRAVMLAASTGPVAVAALTGGAAAVASFDMQVGRAVRPMLASSAADVPGALAKITGEVAVDVKIDGIRIQAHRNGPDVALFTRSLDDITARLPEVVEVVRALPVERAVLDAEVISLAQDGRPRAFQETASRTATSCDATQVTTTALSVFFFDCLVIDEEILLDAPLRERLARLDGVVPAGHRVDRVITADPAEAQGHYEMALARGHEGVVVKAIDAPYAAGRRGAGWIKVKPRHTVDLVVLAVEWGSGRRRGLLSNIHLGARSASTGEFVMLGKTFKGMTDEMLAWQTARFTELALDDPRHSEWVVQLRPEQVVEIAFDGLQRSTRYPGGLALRFARVLRYRHDKTAAQADTIESLRASGGIVT